MPIFNPMHIPTATVTNDSPSEGNLPKEEQPQISLINAKAFYDLLQQGNEAYVVYTTPTNPNEEVLQATNTTAMAENSKLKETEEMMNKHVPNEYHQFLSLFS